jgi:beta-glucosidase
VAVPQGIRWGRTYEAYAQDTATVSTLAAAYLVGLQGDDLADPSTVLGTPKHFIGDGGTLWGTGGSGYAIDQGDMQVDEETLRALYLPPYQAVIEAGAQSIMVSFSSWNGVKMHANHDLITDVLKNELGFPGFVVSDWGGIDQVDRDYYTAVVTAINAGIDMNMVPYDYVRFIDTMKQAVENGDITEERIDDAVRRILTVKFNLGLFEHPYGRDDLLEMVGGDAHRELAREAVQKSLVLLKNDDVLPLATGTPRIYVAGRDADDIGVQCGGWTIEWQGGLGSITPGTTILDAIEHTVSSDTTVVYDRGGDFSDAVDENGKPIIADVGIVVVGEQPYAEGRGDNGDLSLTRSDLKLIENASQYSKKLVVILLSGRPLIITDEIENWDAVVAAWLPGTEGEGVVDGLFGLSPITGKLSFEWPASLDQIPLGASDSAPLFPLGYGLETENSVPMTSSSAYNFDGEWKLTWSDEFDGAADTPINAEYWTCELGGSGWGNAQLEYDTDRIENVAQTGDSTLAITAREEKYRTNDYTSARCNTRGKAEFTYGKVEARIKLPEGQGIWPAFWMLGANLSEVGWPGSGEIDIMEYIGKESRSVHGTIHGPGYSGSSGVGMRYILDEPVADDYHVFGIEWEPDVIRWYVDGELFNTVTPESLYGHEWVFDHDFFLIINVAVGGYWPGNPDKTTVFPQQMLIDWIRVYQRG